MQAPDLERLAGETMSWIWDGYLARGSITLFCGEWKSGKTTLVSLLSAKLGRSGKFLDQPHCPARVAVVSEEAAWLWQQRHLALRFGAHMFWMCRPFHGRPSPEQWRELLAHLKALRRRVKLDVVVIDPLSAFLPMRSENAAGDVLDAVLPLHGLTEAGLAVLLVHHPRKGQPREGQMARGSGALSSAVDTLIEMRRLSRDPDDRRRQLLGFSRHPETPRERIIELDADGERYAVCPNPRGEETQTGMAILTMVLQDVDAKLTRRQLLAEWPEDHVKPAPLTLWKWLESGVKSGQICRYGRGRRLDPFRYWLAGRENLLPRLEGLPDPAKESAELLQPYEFDEDDEDEQDDDLDGDEGLEGDEEDDDAEAEELR